MVKCNKVLLCLGAQAGCVRWLGNMGCHYSTRDFFRQMPNRLLARYFEARGVLAGLELFRMFRT